MGKAKGFLGKYGASYFLLSFWLILFLVFTVIPIAISVVMSFTDFDMVRLPRFVGLQNYTTLFLDDDIFIKSLGNTLFYALVTGPAGYLLSFLVAWLLSETSRGVRAVLMLIFYAPTLAGNVYMVWTYIFSGDSYGMLNSLLLRLGLIADPIQWLNDPAYNSIVVIVVILWMSMGAGFLSFVAGFQQLNVSLFEAGAIDGIRNRWMELWYITLPNMLPMLIFGAVMQIAKSFAVADVSMELAGFPSIKYAAHTIDIHAFDYGFVRFEMGYACAIAVLLFILMVGANQIVQRLLRKVGD